MFGGDDEPICGGRTWKTALEELEELEREWREDTEGHGPGVCDAAVCEICVYLHCADALAPLIERLAEERTKANDEIRRLRILCSNLESQRQLLIDGKNTEVRGQ